MFQGWYISVTEMLMVQNVHSVNTYL